MLSFNEYLKMANDAVAAIQYPAQPDGLYQPIRYTMSLGGKRIRPVLVLMACDAVGGNPAKALDAAVGLEMFHNFTLLHDDLMDRSPLRRGMPTVYVKWDPNTAVLSGDAMLTMATQLICRTQPDVLPKVIALFNRTAMEIYEGQQYDVEFEHRNDVTIDEYVEMIRLKTSVLLGCAFRMGAIIGGADDTTADALYQVGMLTGVAFQLQDDLLDVWGDEKTFGKPIGGDIMNNKKTALLITAINRATGETADELNRWLNMNDAPREEKIAAVTDIYNRLGLKQYAESLIEDYSARALQTLDFTDISDEARDSFRQLILRLVKRNK